VQEKKKKIFKILTAKNRHSISIGNDMVKLFVVQTCAFHFNLNAKLKENVKMF
jgi:hypothetical protein